MNSEAGFKTAFRNSVRSYGGYSIPLAAPMLVGIPDMYVIMPGFIPILLEAKWLGHFKRDKFKRTIPFTTMQQHWLNECNIRQEFSALGLIGFMYDKLYHAMLWHTDNWNEKQIITDAHLLHMPSCIWAPKFKTFELLKLFVQSPIPKLPIPLVNTSLTNAEHNRSAS